MLAKLRKERWIILTLLTFLLAGSIASGEELTSEEILEKIKGKFTFAGSGTATVNLITENEKGEQRTNQVKIYYKSNDEAKKQLIEYLEPADVRGTKFLSITEEGKEEMMWLYLPYLGREKRIVSQAKGKSFMGTDFTYEEIGGSRSYEENYSAQKLEDETFEDYPCYVLKLLPLEEDNEYTYLKIWVWKEEFLPLKIEFYKEEEKLTKTLTNSDLREEDGEYEPFRIVMADEVEGTRTIIEILEIEEKEVSEDYFTLRYLRR